MINAETAEGNLRNIGGKVKEAAGSMAGDAKTEFEGKADQAAGSAKAMYGDAKEAVRNGSDQLSSIASDVASAANRTASWVSAEASELSDRAYQQAEQARKYASVQVQEKPVAMLLLAGLVGGIIGHMLSYPRR